MVCSSRLGRISAEVKKKYEHWCNRDDDAQTHDLAPEKRLCNFCLPYRQYLIIFFPSSLWKCSSIFLSYFFSPDDTAKQPSQTLRRSLKAAENRLTAALFSLALRFIVLSGQIYNTLHRNHWFRWKFSRFFANFHGKQHILMTRLELLFGLSIQLVSNAKQHSRTKRRLRVSGELVSAPSPKRESAHTHSGRVWWGGVGCLGSSSPTIYILAPHRYMPLSQLSLWFCMRSG